MTELYINNTLVDLTEDVAHSLNYSIADIREPDKRDTSYSKTINIAGSKESNKLFQHLFEVNVTSQSFNPNLKASAVMYADAIPVFRGYAQLKKINLLDEYDVEYEVVMYGKLGDLFFDLGDNELTELDLSEYNHTLNRTNIITSWNIGNKGNGYVYPMVDRALNDTITWNINDWQPAIYLKTYVDKIFEYAGYTYESDFLNTSFFKSLIMPFTGEGLKLTEAAINARRLIATQTTSVNNNAISGYTTYTTWQINSEDYDAGNNYNTGTYQWTCPATGRYVFTANVIGALRFVPSSPAYFRSSTSSINIVNMFFDIVKEDTSGTKTILFSGNLPVSTVLPSGLISGDTTTSTVSREVSTVGQGVTIATGEKVYVRFSGRRFTQNVATSYTNFTNGSGTPVSGDVYFVTSSGTKLTNAVINDGYKEGETVLMNSVVHTKIKMWDLLKSVITMFNLYIEQDNDDNRKLIITPRNDFYNDATVDWSSKLDLNSNIEILPMSALDARRYRLTYDYDEDYYNKYYKEKYNRVYGDRVIDVVNDFVSEEKEIKLIWSATIPTNNNKSDRIIPTIWASDGTTKQISAKPRLLYYYGTRSCQTWDFTDSGGNTTYTVYPYAGHLDDPINSTIDINFGVVNELLYGAQYIIYTNNNIYNKYHKQFIEEITDKDSKVVTAYFRLTPSDIYKLDFRKNYFFNNSYFRLNKIYDYNPTGNELTRCEFLSIKEATTFESSGVVYNGGSQPYEQYEESFPTFKTAPPTEGNPYTNIVRGLGNNVAESSRNVFVIGDFNTIGGDVDGAFIMNSSGNVIAGGLQNVTLINSNGQTVNDDNATYFNNIRLDNIQRWEKVSFDFQDVFDAIATQSFAIYSLKGKEVLHSVVSIASEQWLSTGNGDVNELYFDIGIEADTDKFVVGDVNVVNYYSSSQFDSGGTNYMGDFTAETPIKCTYRVVGNGMNVSGLAFQGIQDVYLLISKIE